MAKEIKKAEFKQQILLEMVPGDVLKVICSNYNEYNTAGTMSRLTYLRKEEELKKKGIRGFKVEKTDEWNVTVTAY